MMMGSPIIALRLVFCYRGGSTDDNMRHLIELAICRRVTYTSSVSRDQLSDANVFFVVERRHEAPLDFFKHHFSGDGGDEFVP